MILCSNAKNRVLRFLIPVVRHSSTNEGKSFSGAGYQPRLLSEIYDIPTSWSSTSLKAAVNDLVRTASRLPAPASDPAKFHPTHATMPLGHQILYFHAPSPLFDLMSDGSDFKYSPGSPFTSQLWAGGELSSRRPLRLDGPELRCIERIKRVEVRGEDGKEKAYIHIQRSVLDPKGGETVPGPYYIREERTLVYLRAKEDISEEGRLQEENIVKGQKDCPSGALAMIPESDHAYTKPQRFSPNNADFTFPIVPTPELLLRFSFLTHNYHKIHFDKQYAQQVEGYRNLLVHGPLSVIIILEALRHFTLRCGFGRGRPTHVKYSNIAPLYAEEEMNVCGRHEGDGVWSTWILGANGRIAVKARVSLGSSRKKREGTKENDEPILDPSKEFKESKKIVDELGLDHSKERKESKEAMKVPELDAEQMNRKQRLDALYRKYHDSIYS